MRVAGIVVIRRNSIFEQAGDERNVERRLASNDQATVADRANETVNPPFGIEANSLECKVCFDERIQGGE